jgi:acetyl-CoA carboxylase carboxyltransferase component
MVCENGLARLEKEQAALVDTDAYKRLSALFDGGVFTELDRFAKNGDTACGVVTAYGNINGAGAYAFSQDVTVRSGAMCRAQGEKIKKIYDLALKNGCPVVGIFDSKGAACEEGIDAIEAYGELIAAAGKISGVVPMVSVVAGTCVGSAAVLAAVADVTVMNESGELCVNSSAVTGDENVGKAESVKKCGLVDIVADSDISAVSAAVSVLSYLPNNNLSVPAVADYVAAAASGEGVIASITSVCDAGSFTELLSCYGKCAVVGFARIAGNSVGVVATDSAKNDGKLCAKGAVKIARFVRLCDAFSIPVVTLLDCAGFMGGADDELDGSLKAVATLTSAYAEATTAKVTVITGKAYGTAFTAMAGRASGTDIVLSLADAEICTLEPMTAVQFLYKDRLGEEMREDLEKEYILTEGSPFNAARNGNIDDIITADEIAVKTIAALDMLASKRVSTLDKKHSNMPFYR